MKKNNFLTKAFTLLFVALFSLTGARAQYAVSDITASHISTNSANLSWTGNNTYLRYRALTGTVHTYDFEDHTFQGWTPFDLSNYGRGDGGTWVVYSTNEVYTSYQPGPDGHKSNEMVTCGSYSSNHFNSTSSGGNGLYGDITPNDYLVSPQVKLGGVISFWAKGLDPVDFAENFSVYVSTSGNTIGYYDNPFANNVIASNIVTTAKWTRYVFDLGAYSGNGYVAIRHHNCTGQDQLCIDDIVIREPGTNDSWSSTVTLPANSTSYSFPNNLSATTAYQVEVGTGRNANNVTWNKGTGFMTTNDNPAPTELSADPVEDMVATVNWWGISPQYRVYYRKDAEDGPSYFFEDFEGNLQDWKRFVGRGGQTPSGISGFSQGFGKYNSGHYEPHNGDGAVLAWSWHGNRNYYANNWLISPKITMGAMVKFWVEVSPGYPDKFEVLFYPTNDNSVTAADTSKFTVVLRELAPAERHHGWKRVTISLKELGLENYIDQPGFVAIHHKLFGGEGGNYFYVDDFGIYEEDIPGEVDWSIAETTGPELSKELTDLIPNSLYEYYVVGLKNGVESPESEIETFRTKFKNTYDLPDAGKNAELVEALAGESGIAIRLAGRTIYGGKWNTLYLPFDLTLRGSPLAGADVRELKGASYDGETQVLTLNFSEPLTALTANVPYIIKPNSDIQQPRFSNTTIRGKMNSVQFNLVEGENINLWFRGTYDPLNFDATNKSILFMNARSNLVYPVNGSYLNSQRAYFEFKGIHAGNPITQMGIKELVVNLDEDPTGISELFGVEEEGATWYDLNGRKLAGKPAQKGIYINNGKKTIIK